MPAYKKILRKTGKGFLYLILGIFILLGLLLIFINTKPGKQTVRNQVVKYLSNKLHSNVKIGSVDYSLPQWLELNNVYFEDQQKDTLLFGEKLKVNISMFKLLRGNTDIQKVQLDNIFINLKRAEKDSNFNFQFIVDAFTGNKATTANKDTAEMKITLDNLILNNVSFKMDDKFSETYMTANIKKLNSEFDKFQPDRLNFAIKNLDADSVNYFMRSHKETVVDTTVKIISDSALNEPTYGLYITSNRFKIKSAKVDIENTVTGMKYKNDLEELKLTEVLFNQEQSIATADSLLLQNGFVFFNSAKTNTTNVVKKELMDTVPSASWLIKSRQVNLNKFAATYNDNNLAAVEGFDAAHIDAQNINADIASFLYSEDTTRALVKQLTLTEKSGLRLDTTHANILFTDRFLVASDLYLKTANSLIQKEIKLSYDSVAGIMLNPKNALIEADLNNTIIAFNDLYILMPALKTSFPPQQFANNKVTLQTELKGNLQRLYLPYLRINGLSGTSLSGSGTLYNLTDAANFRYDLNINSSRLLKRDLLKFVPPENQAQLAQLPDIINMQGRFTGDANNLVADFNTVNPGLNFNGKVSLTNIQNPESLQYNLAINNATLSKKTILGFIPAGTLPENINLPETVNARGKFKGNLGNFDSDLQVATDYGNFSLKGFLKNYDDPDRANYNLNFNTADFNIGKLIGQDSVIGKVNGNFFAKGTGFDYKKMNTVLIADINNIYFNKYNYTNAAIKANLQSGYLESTGAVNDPNLILNFDVSSNLANAYPTLVGFVNVDTARLQPLQLYADTLDFSLFANIKVNNLQPGALDIETYIDTIRMLTNTQRIFMDTVSLIATSEEGVDDINFKSPFAYANVNGAFDYDKLPTAIIRYINNYYKFQPVLDTSIIRDQQVNFTAQIKEHPFIKAFVPELVDYDSMYVSGKFTSADTDSALNVTASIPYLQYGANKISQANFDVNSRNGKINYVASVDTLQTTDLSFYGTRLSGAAAQDSLAIKIITQDDKAKDWFALNADFFQEENVYNFKLKDSLLLNYEEWSVAPDNLISYGPFGLLVNNFSIKSDTASIEANSKEQRANSPIDVTINNFNLKSISSLISGDTLFAAGVLSVQALISEIDKSFPAFTGTAQIESLEIMEQPIGNITATAQKQNDNEIAAQLSLTGNDNEATVDGSYFLRDAQNQFNVDVNIKQITMATVQGLAAGQLENSSGFLSGDLKINGKFQDPKWNGQLNFNEIKFTPTVLGAPYLLNNQKIVLAYPQIRFDNFTINDSVNHAIIIKGNVTAQSPTLYNFDLGINGDDFIIMNAQRAINSEFYGFASIDADLNIKGNSEAPNLNGTVKVNDKSEVTLVLPETNYQKDEGLTVVKFIDTDTFDIYNPPKPFTEKKREGTPFAKYLNYNFSIDISKNALFTIIIDPSTGDEIQVQGGALLNAGVDPGGNLALAGIYELEDGHYNFSYQFLSRRFDLQKGSTIQFSGAPMDARIDITASYTIETNSRDLLGSEITSSNTSMYNLLNQKVPFRVIMNLTGVLSRPEIKFSLSQPDGTDGVSSELKTTIDNKLNQLNNDEAAMNKQVFSLLLFGRFVGEQSSDFFSGNGTNFEDIARQSVSQFLSTAIDQIAGDLIKGVDIDVALNSYEDYNTTGSQQKTDLNIALSKKFLNDRLTITVGKNFGLEGQDAASKTNTSAASSYIPDFTASYQLTKDGRYLIKGYRKNAYEAILDGYVIETGMSFVVTLDYEKFREIFRRKNKKPATKLEEPVKDN